MSKYTAEQVCEAVRGFAGYSHVHHGVGAELLDIATDYAALLRERESAKAGVTDAMVATFVENVAVILSGAPFPSARSYAKAREISDLMIETVAPMLASARVPEAELIALKNLAYDMRQQAGNNNRLTHIGWAQRVERVITMLAAAPKPEKE